MTRTCDGLPWRAGRRRGRDVDLPWRAGRDAAATWIFRGGRDAAAAATWIFRGRNGFRRGRAYRRPPQRVVPIIRVEAAPLLETRVGVELVVADLGSHD